jgi:small-conductance mechanosensitive channel
VKDNSDAFALSCDVFEQIKKRFDEANIEIAYHHRGIINKTVTNGAEKA